MTERDNGQNSGTPSVATRASRDPQTITDDIRRLGEAQMLLNAAWVKLKEVKERLEQQGAIDDYVKAAFVRVQEGVLQAHDIHCQLYIDGYVDKRSFKILFEPWVRDLVANKDFESVLTAPDTNYPAIMTVYREWCGSA